jgi:hypothetical protein
LPPASIMRLAPTQLSHAQGTSRPPPDMPAAGSARESRPAQASPPTRCLPAVPHTARWAPTHP